MSEGAIAISPITEKTHQEMVDIALASYRARLLSYLEDTFDDLPPEELVSMRRRVKVITGDAWDGIRKIVLDLESESTVNDKMVSMDARLATLETHVLEGGAGTLKGRVHSLEQR